VATGPDRAVPKCHAGLLLAGWGVFNLVEGVIDHHLRGVHHVRDDLGRRCRGTSASESSG
jgi:uncharacterized membrane protein